MLTKIIYKNFRSNLKNYILFFLSNIVAIMELFVFRGLKEIVLQIVKDTETAFLFRIDFTMALGMISVITIMLMAYAMIYYLKSRIRDYGAYGHFPRPSGPRSPARQGHIKRPVLRLAEPSFLRPANQCC